MKEISSEEKIKVKSQVFQMGEMHITTVTFLKTEPLRTLQKTGDITMSSIPSTHTHTHTNSEMGTMAHSYNPGN
jgi:hypothetical protein